MNRKVFPKLDFYVPEEVISEVVLSSPGVIEPVLSVLREKIDKKLADIASKKPVFRFQYNKSCEILKLQNLRFSLHFKYLFHFFFYLDFGQH